ncbi:hypothetical protein OHU45_02580 [Streptomyces tubercidicus]|nr:hypothetical protein OG761_02405 [Streptomyces tubercidicus]WSX24498.1 hypothetical protein OG690_34935 [Streptomyces tubercidicus]
MTAAEFCGEPRHGLTVLASVIRIRGDHLLGTAHHPIGAGEPA